MKWGGGGGEEEIASESSNHLKDQEKSSPLLESRIPVMSSEEIKSREKVKEAKLENIYEILYLEKFLAIRIIDFARYWDSFCGLENAAIPEKNSSDRKLKEQSQMNQGFWILGLKKKKNLHQHISEDLIDIPN